MKKTLGAALCGLALLATVSAALAAKHGGFVPNPDNTRGYSYGHHGKRMVTVQQAKELRDDAHVTLQGYIVEEVRHEKYLFTDNTGRIVVEIDDDDWGGNRVTPNDLVCLHGEVDRHRDKIEIDVDWLHLVTQQ